MCGISGFYSESKFNKGHLTNMLDAMKHRGPDAEGVFIDQEVHLGHKRLSIIDLSTRANQPMFSHNNNYVIVFNGEIYNFQEIAKELSNNNNIIWNTSSDTEVILEAYIKWGDDFVNKLNGMFAICIYNKESKEIKLFRDRIGIKPLYYYYDGKNFAFASEIKSLLQLPIDKSFDQESVKDYLFLEYVPGENTSYKTIKRLKNGHSLSFDGKKVEIKCFYDILDHYNPSPDIGEEAFLEQFEELLLSSLKYRSIADVPIGAFLSGGTDSSVICAAFQEVNSQPINSFTIGFDVKSHDESGYAEQVAKQLGTNHTLSIAKGKDGIKQLEKMVNHYDDLFAVPSNFPSLQVCEYAKNNVTIALGGDGGDELFMGYGYYNWYNRINKIKKIGGKAGLKAFAKVLQMGNHRQQRAARVFDINNTDNMWIHIWSQEQYMFNEKEIGRLTNSKYTHKTTNADWQRINAMDIHPWQKISLFDIKNYLANNLTYKMDIASMANSLEVRLPLLDHRLVEFAINLPMHYKQRDGEQKYLMKKYLEKHISKDLIYRKKWGFPAPMNKWLQNDFAYLIDEKLNKENISKYPFLNYREVEKLVIDFRAGKEYNFKRIWALINFCLVAEKFNS